MSVRHLGGALRWVVVESLEERLEAMQERLSNWGFAGVTLGAKAAPGAPRGCKRVNVPRDMNSRVEAFVQEDCSHTGNTAEEAVETEELLLRRQLRGLDQVSAMILAEINRSGDAGNVSRVRALEKELQEAAELKCSAAHCLETRVAEEGRNSSEFNTLSSECTSEGTSSTSATNTTSPPVLLTSDANEGASSQARCNSDQTLGTHGPTGCDYERSFRRCSSAGQPREQPTHHRMYEWQGKEPGSVGAPRTERRRSAASPSRHQQMQKDLFRVYGVSVAPERPRTNRPATVQTHYRRFTTGENSSNNSINRYPQDAEGEEMMCDKFPAKGIEVVDASGTGVSVVVRRMVRPTQRQRRNSCAPAFEAVNKAHMARRPVLRVRRDVQTSKSQSIIPGLREATEAAAEAIDAAMTAVAASSTSAPHTPRSSIDREPLYRRGSSSLRLSRENSVECGTLLNKRRVRSAHPRRIVHQDAEFVQARREEGNRLVQNKQYEEAVRAYSEAIERDPENDIILCNRAAAYLFMNQHALALLDCESVLHRSPSNFKAHWRAAKALLYANRVQEAKRHYRVARELCIDPLEERAIGEEVKAMRAFEMYYVHMKECRWIDGVSCADQLLRAFGSTGAASLPWRCRKLEALLHLDPWRALEDIKRLREMHPEYAELLFLHAKSLFFCAHDAKSTEEALQLVSAARTQKVSEGGVEDTRYAMLERTVMSFERHRDRGNTAYSNGDWGEAYAAYTRCLSLDPLNKSLLAVTYCNRAAACMQGGRWNEALSDVHRSIQINGGSAKAYSRRARIHLHFFSQRAASTIDNLELAIKDLNKAVELAPTDENQQHLAEALRMRQMREERRKESQSGSSSSNGDDTSEKRRFHAKNPYHQSGFFRSQRKPNGKSNSGSNQNESLGLGSLKADCAKVLGLDSSIGLDVKSLAKAYREAALRWHPDKWAGAGQSEHHVAEQKFKEINMAYQSLKEMIVRCQV
ncbi:putative TPR-repeat-containing chaperone protein DNAJ [Trypanosoma grayi]|uniref:putative TPR-repeat-containing chaperone protein DNAJ n=1 Tax=Trypanosoma grayi TaxID=71804 RepID=UPI0004F41D5A|nr:putative TPR-repeat-containing chaperone protein DNAJ [Trypanosoma grayi]KEG09075.1 putative TPR-repeat-containing chaperone protein DNAJ [Trypanosoma grayi]